MERDEEIIKASTEIFKENGDEFAKVVQLFWMSAFISGAKWSDEHPKDVWHPANEEPSGGEWRIICQDEGGKFWIKDWADVILLYNTWNTYVTIEKLVKWAYIDELIKE